MKFYKHLIKDVKDRYWLFKSILIMKLTLILILLFNLNVVANAYSQTRVTLNLKSVISYMFILSLFQKLTLNKNLMQKSNNPCLLIFCSTICRPALLLSPQWYVLYLFR